MYPKAAQNGQLSHKGPCFILSHASSCFAYFTTALTWFLVRRRACTSPGNKTLQPHGEPAPPNYRGIFSTNLQPSPTLSSLLPIKDLSLKSGASLQYPNDNNYFCHSLTPPADTANYWRRKRCRFHPYRTNHSPPLHPVE